MALTRRAKRFIQEFVNNGRRLKDAGSAAGYSTANPKNLSSMIQRPEFQEAIASATEDFVEHLAIDEAEVVHSLIMISQLDRSEACCPGTTRFMPLHMMPETVTRCIKAVWLDPVTTLPTKITWESKEQANAILNKIAGLENNYQRTRSSSEIKIVVESGAS